MNNTDHGRLLVKVASLYYEQELTQYEIAERLSLSRQKVQRLLRQARVAGIVQISITPMKGIFFDLEKTLEHRFGLREALVVETASYEHQTTVAREVGAAAAEYLLRVVQSNQTILISWGESILGMVNAISCVPQIEDTGLTVVQGLGGLIDPNNDTHAADLTKRLAKALNGRALMLPAPGAAGNRRAAEAFYSDPYVAQVLHRARTANLAFVGIGAPRPDSVLVREGDIVTWPELAKLIERGAVGDINLRCFDQLGQMIHSDLDDRIIGLTLSELKQIDCVVGVAGGSAKFKAIRGALEGKLVDVLVTDHISAQQLLK